MKIYCFDKKGRFTKEKDAKESPREPGVYLCPMFATFTAPPNMVLNGSMEGYFNGTSWTGVTPEAIPSGGVYAGLSNAEARVKALELLEDRIIAMRKVKNAEDFMYKSVLYVSDQDNIEGVSQRISDFDDKEDIPTFVGTSLESHWATAENTFVKFTVSEFKKFANHYYDHREKNFTNYTMLTIAARTAYENGATVEELEQFDVTQGWD